MNTPPRNPRTASSSVQPATNKRKATDRLKSEAVVDSIGFNTAYNTTNALLKDIKKRDNKTRRFKEPLVVASMVDMEYKESGKRGNYAWEDNPWGGDLGDLQDAFDKYRNDPVNKVVTFEERNTLSESIDATKDWYDHMRRSQWAVETERNGPTRNFNYEQQIMEQMITEKESETVQGGFDVDEDPLL